MFMIHPRNLKTSCHLENLHISRDLCLPRLLFIFEREVSKTPDIAFVNWREGTGKAASVKMKSAPREVTFNEGRCIARKTSIIARKTCLRPIKVNTGWVKPLFPRLSFKCYGRRNIFYGDGSQQSLTRTRYVCNTEGNSTEKKKRVVGFGRIRIPLARQICFKIIPTLYRHVYCNREFDYVFTGFSL